MASADEEDQGFPVFTNLDELEDMARGCLPKPHFDYFAGAADDKITLKENKESWKAIRLLPRFLVDVSDVDTSIQLAGHKLEYPFLIAPMATQCLAHPEGELAVARAAAAKKIPMIMSTMATCSVQEMASVTPRPLLFFQLYMLRDKNLVEKLVGEVTSADFKAIVLTVDAPLLGNREADKKNKFHFPSNVKNTIPNYSYGDNFHKNDGGQKAFDASFAGQVEDSITWSIVGWLKSLTNLPIWIKGIMSPRDALLAVDHGVDAIICSNHGGRQLDTCVATSVALPKIVSTVAGRIPVLVDGGIRRGTDILKALALGASGVLLGRSVVFALGVGGQPCVEAALELLCQEFKRAMVLSGCSSTKQIDGSLIWKD